MSWLCRVGLHKWCRHPEVKVEGAWSKDCQETLSMLEAKELSTRITRPELASLGILRAMRETLRSETTARCTTCGLEHEHEPITKKWVPISGENRCLRCGENHPA